MSDNWIGLEGNLVDGRFPLLRYLGGSGPGAVYLTVGEGPEGERAAIKLVRGNAYELERQLARWNETSLLPHPHLIRLYETGRCRLGGEGYAFVLMERAEEALSEVLPQRALSPEEAREMLGPALDALAFLHARGLVAGELRPQHVLAAEERLKLASEHVCKSEEAGEPPLEPTTYDAPELEQGRWTPAADVWALGMTLVEALTQRVPEWDRAGKGDPALPEGLPEPFAAIARHALRRDPARRWSVEQIQACLKQPPAPAAVARAAKPAAARGRRRSWIPALILAAVVIGAIWVAHPRPEAQKAAPGAAATETTPRTAEPAPSMPAAPKEVQPASSEQSSAAVPAEQAAPKAEPEQETAAPAREPKAERRVAKQSAAAASAASAEEASDAVVEKVMPEVLPKAMKSIQGSVKIGVKVRVDASGKVADASLATSGGGKYFPRVSLEAARQWKFRPAGAGGKPVAGEWMVNFLYKQSGITAGATRMNP